MRLADVLGWDKLRTGLFQRGGDIRAARLKPDDSESIASVHENHAQNISTAMKALRSLGATVTKVKHTDYEGLPMLKKRGIATGDMSKSAIHFTSGKKKFKLHVRTAHKLGLEGAEHNKAFTLDHDNEEDDGSAEKEKE